MKITRRQLKRIISEMLIKENREDRLTLWLKVEGDELVLHVNESGMVYDMPTYVDLERGAGGLAGLQRDFKADHGMEIPPGTMVIDYDGIGMDDLPLEEAFEWVKEAYADMF